MFVEDAAGDEPEHVVALYPNWILWVSGGHLWIWGLSGRPCLQRALLDEVLRTVYRKTPVLLIKVQAWRVVLVPSFQVPWVSMFDSVLEL